MSLAVESYENTTRASEALAAAVDASYMGGGTLLMRAVNYAEHRFNKIVLCSDVALKAVEVRGSQIRLGASVTMAEILAEPALTFLAPVARSVGGPAVRSVATVGGNLFASNPYGDLTTALLALGAKVVVVTGGREAEVDLQIFLSERERSRSVLVKAVVFDKPDNGVFRYNKVTRTKPKGASVMTIALWLPLQNGRVVNPRVAYGAIASTPVRASAVERALDGCPLNTSGISAALQVATDGITLSDDALASSWYRQQVAPVHLKRLILTERY